MRAKKLTNLLSVSTKLTGKMEGMTAITSAMTTNPNCVRLRKIKGSICEKCFSHTALSYRDNVKKCYERNGEILSKGIIPENELPFINATFTRLESHGDLINEIHLQNYINICKKNPQCYFVLWSKQYNILLNYFKNNKAPKNFRLIVSSLMINKAINLKRFEELGLNCKVFTVYNKDYVEQNKVEINCGGRSCLTCRKCYTKSNKVKEIKELLK